jgi:RimJ/RimL family protein N-acetyltransferase
LSRGSNWLQAAIVTAIAAATIMTATGLSVSIFMNIVLLPGADSAPVHCQLYCRCGFIKSMADFPTLTTERLLLRQFQLTDARNVQQLAGVRAVAERTLVIPHPYEDGVAEQWIEQQQNEFDAGRGLTFAIRLAVSGTLIGSIGMEIQAEHRHARLSYWLGLPYWNQGYATEAVKAVLAHGFTMLNLHRIYAPHFHTNPASGRVLQKAGMTYEGRMRQHYLRFGEYQDLELYGMLQQDFLAKSEQESPH